MHFFYFINILEEVVLVKEVFFIIILQVFMVPLFQTLPLLFESRL